LITQWIRKRRGANDQSNITVKGYFDSEGSHRSSVIGAAKKQKDRSNEKCPIQEVCYYQVLFDSFLLFGLFVLQSNPVQQKHTSETVQVVN
jgi:hypothetical protein